MDNWTIRQPLLLLWYSSLIWMICMFLSFFLSSTVDGGVGFALHCIHLDVCWYVVRTHLFLSVTHVCACVSVCFRRKWWRNEIHGGGGGGRNCVLIFIRLCDDFVYLIPFELHAPFCNFSNLVITQCRYVWRWFSRRFTLLIYFLGQKIDTNIHTHTHTLSLPQRWHTHACAHIGIVWLHYSCDLFCSIHHHCGSGWLHPSSL